MEMSKDWFDDESELNDDSHPGYPSTRDRRGEDDRYNIARKEFMQRLYNEREEGKSEQSAESQDYFMDSADEDEEVVNLGGFPYSSNAQIEASTVLKGLISQAY
jgi:hypothetical protein